MDFLWTPYGLPMEQHRRSTVAAPDRIGMAKALASRRGQRGFVGSGLN